MMTYKWIKRLSLLCAVLSVLLLGLAWGVLAQEGDQDPVDLTVYDSGETVILIEPTGNNGYCTLCHSQPQRTVRLEDGSLLNLFVDPDMIAASVHGVSETSPGLGCLDCHGEDAFPHIGLPPEDGRLYTIDSNAMCTSCHEGYGEELSVGLHTQAIAAGNVEAAVCTDCHGAHHIQSAEHRPELVSGVCGDCHEITLDEWQMTAHADIGQLGCAVCHDHHTQNLRVGETTTDLCLNCHQDNLPETFVHDTHITAVQGSDHPVECADCHMYVETVDDVMVSLGEPISTGHSMLLDATPCDTCHTELISSGEWDEIIAEQLGVSSTSDEETAMEDAHVDEEQHADANALSAPQNTRFAIQGLLLGLGLGVTFTIVFVTRNTAPAPRRRDEDEGEE